MKTIILTALLLLLFIVGCNKDDQPISLDKVTTEDFYGAWISTDDISLTKMMLCIKKNNVYSEAYANNAFIILYLTSTDTTVEYAGAFEVSHIGGCYLHSYDQYTSYDNEIYDFSKNSCAIYSATLPENKRHWTKTNTDLLTKPPK